MTFQIQSLQRSSFNHLFTLSSQELAAHRAIRVIADKNPGFPCRVSLADAEIGEPVLLVHYQHHTTASPFQASHAVYVRPDAVEAKLSPGEIPAQLLSRTLSLRAYDREGMMVEASLAEGNALEAGILDLLQIPSATYLHLHYAKPGCYAALVKRYTRPARISSAR